ncbi:hypothetical protein AKJ09_07990 [Labilithrix luteola]|uniref:Uncharacterized protein n=1 Tax=Labilithrix luteola TaxID=1391654 RepID=A0A0K1Q6Q4_9BACT|nr:hypothetical protein [Labilithrix luteola]AKV01327.1 hypothetical protein AKJ09_07990 [Labilithrix luteola]
MTGRVVVRDLVGRETSRATVGASCKTILHSLALFVALAIDESEDDAWRSGERAIPPKDTSLEPMFTAPWPAPAETPEKRPSRPKGGGGLLVATGYDKFGE